MKNKLFVTFLIFLFLSISNPTHAQTHNYNELLQQMQLLLERIVSLQAQLAEIRLQQSSRTQNNDVRNLTPSEYYSGVYDAVYTVTDGKLVPYGETITVPNDYDLWELFTDVIGDTVTKTYISELRIYSDADAKFDAFVEQIGSDANWIVGINSENVETGSRIEQKAAIELFVHEYAHILHYYHPEVSIAFESTFWGNRSHNSNNFVSEYAMIDPEEDFAESFMYFVLNDELPKRNTARKKVLFFYDYAEFQDIKEGIRGRI